MVGSAPCTSVRRGLLTIAVTLGLGATPVLAQDTRCMYAGQFVASGGVTCQRGAQYRCVAGSWQSTGLDCADTTGDQEGLQVDPSRQAPAIGEPAVRQPTMPKE